MGKAGGPVKSREMARNFRDQVNGTLTNSFAFWRTGSISIQQRQVPPMRSVFAALALVTLLGTASAHAERRIFVVANNADDYGVDRCLANGLHCGAAAAASYCKAREFAEAVSYSKVERDEITGAIPVSTRTCHGANCDAFVAIVCNR
jgi:hypothetical protein